MKKSNIRNHVLLVGFEVLKLDLNHLCWVWFWLLKGLFFCYFKNAGNESWWPKERWVTMLPPKIIPAKHRPSKPCHEFKPADLRGIQLRPLRTMWNMRLRAHYLWKWVLGWMHFSEQFLIHVVRARGLNLFHSFLVLLRNKSSSLGFFSFQKSLAKEQPAAMKLARLIRIALRRRHLILPELGGKCQPSTEKWLTMGLFSSCCETIQNDKMIHLHEGKMEQWNLKWVVFVCISLLFFFVGDCMAAVRLRACKVKRMKHGTEFANLTIFRLLTKKCTKVAFLDILFISA